MANNYLNELAKSLIEDLRKRTDPFRKTIIVFKSNALASFFKSYFLKNYDGILLNIKYVTLLSGINDLFNVDENLKMASKSEIISLITKYILDNKDNDLYKDYISDSNGIKLFDLANELASLFDEYEKDLAFGADFNGVADQNKQAKEKKIYDDVINTLLDNNLITLNYVLKDEVSVKKNIDVYLFGFFDLDRQEEAIIDKIKKNIDIKEYYLCEVDGNIEEKLEVIRAPKRIREVEHLHGIICKTLLEDKDARFSDFLVISRNLADYENDINRVFKQDDKDYPDIPYYINVSSEKENEAFNLFSTLLSIYNKGFLVKTDFFDIANNSYIRNNRNISFETIELFKESVEELGVFRGETWSEAIKRMLLSKISDINDNDNVVMLDNKKYLPYDSIGLDDEAIVKFIELYNDINDFILFGKNNEIIKEENLDKLDHIFKKFYSRVEFGIESGKTLSKMRKLTGFLRSNGVFDIPLITLLLILKDQLKGKHFNVGEEFFNGVSFKPFNRGEVLSSKYLFILGAGSNVFDIEERTSNLDFRKTKDTLEDEKTLKLYIKNSKKVYVSFVFRDLKKDSDFYLSEAIKKLYDKRPKDDEIDKISLDEDRDYKDLFTKREFKHRDYYLGLFKTDENGQDDNEEKEIKNTNNTIITNFTISNIKDYLNEPLSLKANLLFGRDYETDMLDYASFELDPLADSNLFRLILNDYLKNFNEFDLNNEEDKKKEKEKLLLSNSIRGENAEIVEMMFNDEYEKVKKAIGKLGNLDKKVIIEPSSIKLEGTEYIIDNNERFIKEVSDESITYYTFKNKEVDDEYKEYAKTYALSLFDLQKKDDKKEKNVTLQIFTGVDKDPDNKEFTISGDEAYEILVQICNDINDLSNSRAYSKKLEGKTGEIEIETIYALIDKLKYDYNPIWDYFKYKDLFNQDNIGYSEKEFKEELKEEKEKFKELAKFYNKEEENDGK